MCKTDRNRKFLCVCERERGGGVGGLMCVCVRA